MLTDPNLHAQVDALRDKFWTGGLSNPLNPREEFILSATLRGYSTGVVARRVESLRGRMGASQSTRQSTSCLMVCWRNLLTVDDVTTVNGLSSAVCFAGVV